MSKKDEGRKSLCLNLIVASSYTCNTYILAQTYERSSNNLHSARRTVFTYTPPKMGQPINLRNSFTVVRKNAACSGVHPLDVKQLVWDNYDVAG